MLVGRYSVPRSVLAETLIRLIRSDGLTPERGATIQRALEIFGSTNLDFVDCWLAARAESEQALDGVWSFDRDFDKLGVRLRPTPS